MLAAGWLLPCAAGAAAVVAWWAVWPEPFVRLAALIPGDTKLFWHLTRASGITAYLLLTASMLLGLGVFTRALDRFMPRASSFTLHEYLSWLAFGFTLLHAGVLLFDRYQPFTFAELLVPFLSAWRPLPLALGILALYATLLVNITFYLKPQVSQRAWRVIHYASFGLYALATAHGVFAGSSSGQAWMYWLYLASGSSVLFSTLYRILLAPRGRHAAASTAGAGSKPRAAAARQPSPSLRA